MVTFRILNGKRGLIVVFANLRGDRCVEKEISCYLLKFDHFDEISKQLRMNR